MKRVYDTGVDSNSISMEVKVGTVGVVYTAINQFRSGGQSVMIKESTLTSNGNIAKFVIGLAVNVRKSYIIIRTLIDLSHLDDAERKREVDLIKIGYFFNGGFSGNQVYNFDNDDIVVSSNNKIVSITKPIEMI